MVVKDSEELAATVSYYLSGGEVSESLLKAREEFINKWFYKADGKSTERCAKVISDFLAKNHNQPRFIPFLVVKYYLNCIIRHILETIPSLAHRLSWGKRHRQFEMAREFSKKKKFSKKEAEELENSIRKALDGVY